MLISLNFLISRRRIYRRLFVLPAGLYVVAVSVYLAIASLRLHVWKNDLTTSSPHPLCHRPQLDDDQEPADWTLDNPQPLRCQEDEADWIDVSNGTFQIKTAARLRHGDIVCRYTPVLRGKDDFHIVRGKPIESTPDGTPLPSDFFEARCIGSDRVVHDGLYSGIAVDPTVIQRCRNVPSQLDILIFGFDAVSRTLWTRKLPNSHQFVVDELEAAVFSGYNIVGDGTAQALLPLLTGKTDTELPESRRGFDGAQTVDDYPWIWRLLKNADYVTQWAEDLSDIGT